MEEGLHGGWVLQWQMVAYAELGLCCSLWGPSAGRALPRAARVVPPAGQYGGAACNAEVGIVGLNRSWSGILYMLRRADLTPWAAIKCNCRVSKCEQRPV